MTQRQLKVLATWRHFELLRLDDRAGLRRRSTKLVLPGRGHCARATWPRNGGMLSSNSCCLLLSAAAVDVSAAAAAAAVCCCSPLSAAAAAAAAAAVCCCSPLSAAAVCCVCYCVCRGVICCCCLLLLSPCSCCCHRCIACSAYHATLAASNLAWSLPVPAQLLLAAPAPGTQQPPGTQPPGHRPCALIC